MREKKPFVSVTSLRTASSAEYPDCTDALTLPSLDARRATERVPRDFRALGFPEHVFVFMDRGRAERRTDAILTFNHCMQPIVQWPLLGIEIWIALLQTRDLVV